ncbi:DinB family protein [Thalassospira marina]|uniref:Damage-inducible protein DinB n=1 Tax=Thalassospira marina TaxID=2048283 RepID=A0A2N3KS65_9PROT|nr:DinB family protein [Thalassospira marina]PKR53392.1 damage-inducible protein DinB [Thalassospira marina]
MSELSALPGTSFYDQARNNAWSNFRLLNCCQKLGAAELTAKRTSFFPGILQTLNHIVIVDWFYIDALLDEGRGRDCFANANPFGDIAELADAQKRSDQKLLDFCKTLTIEAANRPVTLARGQGKTATETAGAVLSHLFVHQTHHRGQVHAMLSGTVQTPPQLDEYYLDCDAEFRGTDFQDLGWDGK